MWQTVVAIGVAIYIQNHFSFNGFRVPFVGNVEFVSVVQIPFTDRGFEVGAFFFIVVAVVVSVVLATILVSAPATWSCRGPLGSSSSRNSPDSNGRRSSDDSSNISSMNYHVPCWGPL